MSSAAKLRHIGRGTAVVASAALVMTSFGPAAFAAWDAAPQNSNLAPSQAAQGVGIVDADRAAANTQGATLVSAGKDAQALSDVRLVIPNSFQAGDTIDLRVFDRSATETQNNRGNSGPSTKMEFSANPKVAVSGPQHRDTSVAITNGTNENTNDNTEGNLRGWTADGRAGVAGQTPGVTPAFDVSLVASTGSQYKDTVRLRINTDPSTGDPDGKWALTLSDLALNLGAEVTPGALRMVPFAYNNISNVLVAAPAVFDGNIEAQARTGLAAESIQSDREIGIYTVPAFVTPVTFEAGTPNIIANAGVQSIGDLVLRETYGASLSNGTYTVHVEGATIANTTATPITAKVTDGGTGESVTQIAPAANGQSFTFQLNNADNTRKSTVTFSGLQLNATQPGRLSFRISGGSVDSYLPSSPNFAGDGAAFAGLPAEGEFAGPFEPYTRVSAQPAALAATPSDDVVTAMSAAELGTGTYAIRRLTQDVTLPDGDVVREGRWAVTSADGSRVFAVSAASDAPELYAPASLTVVEPYGTGTGTVTVATGTPSGTQFVVDSTEITAVTDSDTTNTLSATFAGTSGVLPGDGTYAIDAVPDTAGQFQLMEGTGDTLTAISQPFAAGATTITLTGAYAGRSITVTGGTPVWDASSELVVGGSAVADDVNATFAGAPTVMSIAGDIRDDVANAGDYTVQGDGTIEGGGETYTFVRTLAGGGGLLYSTPGGESEIILSSVPRPTTTFTLAPVTPTAGDVNQQDIVAPTDRLVQVGTVSAGITSIGGSNRFGTAARIADRFVKDSGANTADAAIVVNGMSAPDALSASFLSQREGAPILLTAPGQLPAETVEALRNLGVRKVYVVGGRTAVGPQVHDALRNQDAYMWDTAAGAVKPRGDKLEVVQLSGDNRYQTNWRVNTYAAAQTAQNAPIGQIQVAHGQPLKTTAMLARSSTSNDFVDALSASVLSAGRQGGLAQKRDTGNSTVQVTTGAFSFITAADAGRLNAGQYRLVGTAGQPDAVIEFNHPTSGWTQVGTWTPNNLTFSSNISGVSSVALAGAATSGNVFTVASHDAVYGYDTRVEARNALPVILTQPTSLVSEAASQMRALHIEHMLLIGGDSALAPSVNDAVAGVGATSYRIGGADRWETAANVNRFAMAPATVTAAGQTPGLGFDGNRQYSDANRTNHVGGEMVVHLANGLKFPDALVAGPWISRNRNAMVMTLQNDLPEPTAVFINEKAAQLDRAAGLGQGAAVSSAVLVEANQIASTK